MLIICRSKKAQLPSLKSLYSEDIVRDYPTYIVIRNTFSRSLILLLQLKLPLIFLRSKSNRIYNMQAQIERIELRPGNYYHVFHAMTKKVLMIPEQSSNQYKDKSPVLGNYDDVNLNQVWMIEYIRQKKLHEIVHALSTLVLQTTLKSCKLTFGNWSTGQHYLFKSYQQAEPNTFLIRDKDNPNIYLYADRDGIVQLGQKQVDDPDIRWVLHIAEKTRAITQSVLFQNAFTNMTMDVPQASSKPGEKIIQYPINKRFNQRFRLIFHYETNTYCIENVKSKLVLDIKGESDKEGANIIQWNHTQGLNQRWYLENQGKDLYLIRSALKPELFIGIKNNEFKQCAELVTTTKEDFALWRILGEFDRQPYTLV